MSFVSLSKLSDLSFKMSQSQGYTTNESQSQARTWYEVDPSSGILRQVRPRIMPSFYRNQNTYPIRGKYRNGKFRPNKKSVSVIQRANVMGARTKYVDIVSTESTTTQATAGLQLSWGQIVAGTGNNERTGNDILTTAIGFKMCLQNNSSTNPSTIRVILVELLAGRNLSDADAASILFEGSGTGTSDTDVAEQGDLSDIVRKVNREEFKVLKDQTIFLGAQVVAGVNTGVAYLNFYKKIGKRHRHRSEVTQHPSNGRYMLFVIARDPANDTGTATLEVTCNRQRWFKDV